jgi:predicted PurR-regulated permease PerM
MSFIIKGLYNAMPNNKYFFPLVNLTLILVILLLLSKIGYVFSPIKIVLSTLLGPVIISLFLYYALRPVVRKILRPKMNKGIVVLVTLILFTVLLTVIIIYGGATIKKQFEGSFSESIKAIMNYTTALDGKLGNMISTFEFTQQTLNTLKDGLLNVSSNIFGLFSQIGNLGTQIILAPFILFYLLKEDDKFSESFLSVIPNKYRDLTKDTLHQADSALSTYISGQLIVALFIGVLMYIGYLIIGMPNALLMGFFSMITAIIPFIGAFLGIIPALLIALTINTGMIIKVIVVAAIVQQIEGNLVTPNVIGSKLNVHPLGVIVIVIISVTLMGVMGAFVGLPLYVVAIIVIKSAYKFFKLKKIKIKD